MYDLRPKTCPSINFRLLGLKTAAEEDKTEVIPVTGGVVMSIYYESLRTRLEVAREAEEGNEPVIRDSVLWSDKTQKLDQRGFEDESLIQLAEKVEIVDYTAASGDTASYKQKVLAEQKTSWVESISKMVMNEHDYQSVRELRFIASGFGQGLELNPLSVGVALVLLQRFYDLQPLIFTNNLVLKKEDLDLPRYLYRYTLGTTGWMGLNFFGKGKGFIADAWRDLANLRSLLDYLSIPESDLLVYNLEEDKVFRPGFYVCIDRAQSAVILSVRGTMSMRDGMTDLVCEYVPFKDGLAHSGFLKSSQWFFENIGRQLLMFAEEYGLENIYCLGHSLGGATASLTCMHIHDFFLSRDEGWPMCSMDPSKRINLHCYAYGPPPTVSQTIAGRYDHLITVFINGEDVVPSLSFGSVDDFHLMVSYASSICSATHLFQAIESTPIMNRLQHCRRRIISRTNRVLNPKLFTLGRIHHIVALEAPNNKRYRVVETVGPERFQEIKATSKALRHHMPDRYEVALNEAYATFLQLEREQRINLAETALNSPRLGNFHFDPNEDTFSDEDDTLNPELSRVVGYDLEDSIVGSIKFHSTESL